MRQGTWTVQQAGSSFRHLTFPLIIPFFTINMVLCVKNFLMVFDQIMAMTQGGPAQSTESISFLIYNNGMKGGAFGYQSANAVIFFIVIVAISAAQMSISSQEGGTVIMKAKIGHKTNWPVVILLILGLEYDCFPVIHGNCNCF